MADFKIDSRGFEMLISHTCTCAATDKIVVDRLSVGYMRRDEPVADNDSGWQFLWGFETEEYLDDLDNSALYKLNTIANLDKAIIPYLDYPIGTQLERVEGSDEFIEVE
ncbi:DUF2185 domain-containing protein [Hymenobacter terrestris]|uniref:DUF2185 domain-containing protein n=1 Tax=Hymenobacter terrestris TaxID=2748310 RepID=A0ABX2Q460_9BACT|nr:DUF2185 domain-containing protein [Hymenobacter terrestris]NVO85211.1 DUF2185 domain-containing protein [Hymenobacter terrestris]